MWELRCSLCFLILCTRWAIEKRIKQNMIGEVGVGQYQYKRSHVMIKQDMRE
jgi:hypothetical protein